MSAEILREAYALITGDRQRDYDHPLDDYSKVIDIFKALTGIELTVEQGILFMVSVKMARIRTNLDKGSLHRDSIVDAAGYLGCLSMAYDEQQRRADQ
jgi:hypothetical protein